jgi:AAA15 family ATPase/GTPase
MRVKTLRLKDFKRFNDLTIDLSSRPSKVVAIVGPNGSGKSSVFDAFEQLAKRTKGGGRADPNYYKKSMFTTGADSTFDTNNHIEFASDQTTFTKTSFYIRSAYRFTPRIQIENVRKLPDVEADENRPTFLINQDSRLVENYERLLGSFFNDVYATDLSGNAWAAKNVKGLNDYSPAYWTSKCLR